MQVALSQDVTDKQAVLQAFDQAVGGLPLAVFVNLENPPIEGGVLLGNDLGQNFPFFGIEVIGLQGHRLEKNRIGIGSPGETGKTPSPQNDAGKNQKIKKRTKKHRS
jgi:hypothetical protein